MTPRRILAFGSLVTLAVVLTAVLSGSLFASLDLRIYDTMLRAAGTRPPSGRVAVVAIDDKSLAEMGQWPWRRDVIASLVDRLRASGAAVVALDMLLAEPDRLPPRTGDGGTDETLARAVSAGRVVLGYALAFGTEAADASPCVLHPLDIAIVQREPRRPAPQQLFEASSVTCSLPALSRAAGASGYVNAGPDRDGLLRRIPLVMAFNGHVYPSLALAAVRIAAGTRQMALSPLSGERSWLTLDGRPVPLDERATMLIRFRGKRGPFPHVPATDVLNGRVPADVIRDRIVFVGATALGTGDVVATPFDTSMPGIEVHAAAADTLLQRDFIVTPPYGRAYELLGSVVLGLTAATLVAVAGYLPGCALSVVLLGILWWATAGVAAAGVFLSPLFPTLSVVSTLTALTFARLSHERRRAERERDRRERAHQFTVHSLTSLVESRDGATGRHARRTQQYARLLATRLAELPRFRGVLTPEYVDLIARLAPLHDIGKVGVRDTVLLKAGPLSADEVDEIRRHPGFGHDTIRNAERLAGLVGHADEALLRVAKDIVYTHHERWDGQGYPRGLSGEAIPIGGRIIALVDVYDALIASRSYRPAGTHDEAVAVIRAGRATQFDPDIVDAFLTIEADFRRLTDELRSQAAGQTQEGRASEAETRRV